MEMDVFDSPFLLGEPGANNSLCIICLTIGCRVYGCLSNDCQVLGLHLIQCSDGSVELYPRLFAVCYHHVLE